MKKTYIRPDAEISLFDTKDVITASGSSTDPQMINAGELKDSDSDNSYTSIFG